MSEPITNAMNSEPGALHSQCDLLRSLHVPGRPLVLAECLGCRDGEDRRGGRVPGRRHDQCGGHRGSGL